MKHWFEINARDLAEAQEVVIIVTQDPNDPEEPPQARIRIGSPFGRKIVECEACEEELDKAKQRIRDYSDRWYWKKAQDDEIRNARLVDLTNPRDGKSRRVWRSRGVDLQRLGGATKVSSGGQIDLVADEDEFDEAVKHISAVYGSDPS